MKFKGETGEIKIDILRRSNSNAEDYWDGNWLDTEVLIRVRGFNGVFRTSLRVDELQQFYNEALIFMNRGKSRIEFASMEEGLFLLIELEPSGIIKLIGRGKDDAHNSLSFTLECDTIAMENFVNDFARDLKSYPLVGHIS